MLPPLNPPMITIIATATFIIILIKILFEENLQTPLWPPYNWSRLSLAVEFFDEQLSLLN